MSQYYNYGTLNRVLHGSKKLHPLSLHCKGTPVFTMADSLHMSIAGFRETVLTAVAKLEFQIRDTAVQSAKYSIPAMSTVATDD